MEDDPSTKSILLLMKNKGSIMGELSQGCWGRQEPKVVCFRTRSLEPGCAFSSAVY